MFNINSPEFLGGGLVHQGIKIALASAILYKILKK